MAKLSPEELLEQFKEMTLLEISDFVKKFEEEFDVEAAAPVAGAVVAAAPGAGADAAEEEEKSEYDVILESFGDKKINVIKAIRAILPELGLKDAKALVDEAPKPVLEGAPKEEAEKAKASLEEAGATVTLK